MQSRSWTLMSLVGPFQARIFCDPMTYHRVDFLVVFTVPSGVLSFHHAGTHNKSQTIL